MTSISGNEYNFLPHEAIITHLHDQNTLRSLTLSHQSRVPIAISRPLYEALAKWLSSPDCSLRTVSIGWNDLPLEATDVLISQNCTLEELDITLLTLRACAARVTVVGLCVCLFVCRRLFSHYRLRGGL